MPYSDKHGFSEDILDRAVRVLRDASNIEEPPDDSEERILARLRQASAEIQPETINKRSINMNRIAKIAAIVVIVIGLGGMLARFIPGNRKAGIVFADVVRHFTKAHTAKYSVVIELEGHKPVTIKRKQDFEYKYAGWGSPWDKSGPMGIQMLPRDWARNRQASDPMSGDFEGETLYFFGQADGEGIRDFFQVMGQVHQHAEADLGNQNIEDQPATGFRFEQDGTVYSIWASADTGLPLRIDITNPRLLGQGKVTLNEFKFDVEIPKPAMGMGGVLFREWKWTVSEDELVDALRRWAKRRDGRLPAYLVHQAWFFNTPEYFRNPDLDLETRQQIFKLNSQVIIRGVMFASQLPAGDDWHYLGREMTLDPEDDQTPICWYRPEGSQTYRVIYRDLSVQDVSADELPMSAVAE